MTNDNNEPVPTGDFTSPPGPAYAAPRFYLLKQVFQPRELIIAAVLLLEIATFWLINPKFTTGDEFLEAARYISLTGIAAVGASLVIISGGIDLSPGALYGLAGVVMAFLLSFCHASIAQAIGATLAVGCVVGVFNGAVIAYLGVPPFLVTLGSYSICNGIAEWMCATGSLPPADKPFSDQAVRWLGLIDYRIGKHAGFEGISVELIVMVGLAVIGAFFLMATPVGRHIRAIGGNEQAARHAGVRVPAVKLLVYVLAGATASLAGVFYIARYGGIDSRVGPGSELDIIAAAVVGGVSLQGGKGSPLGAIIGAYIITLLRDGLVFNNVPTAGAKVAVGAFIVFAVVVDRLLKTLDQMGVTRRFKSAVRRLISRSGEPI